MTGTVTPDIDLTNCEREPIHVIGHVQPHGVLVALSPVDLIVLQVSRSAETHFGIAPEAMLGQSFLQYLSDSQGARLATAVAEEALEGNPTYLQASTIADRGPFHISGHRHDGLILLDIEPDVASDMGLGVGQQAFLRQVFTRFDGAKSVAEYCDAVVEKVQELTGFDRVMVYRFEADGSGIVIAEQVKEGYDSFLGLHYPASDVPRQARELLVKSQLRIYPDVAYEGALIVPMANPVTARPLDMSFSVLRGVSKLHTEYLRNMGVRSSLVLAITLEGELWGMVNAQHHAPRSVPFDVRSACEIMTRVISLQLTEKQAQEVTAKRARILDLIESLAGSFSDVTELSSVLLGSNEPALRIAEADGVAMLIDNKFNSATHSMNEGEFRQLVDWLAEHQKQPFWAIDDLAERCPAASSFSKNVAGILSVCLSRQKRDFIVWQRPEWLRTVNWAGNPTKPVEREANSERLIPRKSFAIWQETVTGRSIPWTDFDLEAAERLREALVHSSSRWNVPDAPLETITPEVLTEEDAAEAAARVGRRLGSLLDSLIRFSQVAKIAEAFGECDLNSVIAAASKSLESMLSEAGGSIEVVGRLPSVRADRAQLIEVFVSLISNGIQYNDRAQKHVRIFALDAGAAREYERVEGVTPCVICVEDNGIGMTAEYSEEVFSIFRRVRGKIDLLAGLTVGLPMVRKAMENQSGRVWVKSVVGSGTTFFLEFAI